MDHEVTVYREPPLSLQVFAVVLVGVLAFGFCQSSEWPFRVIGIILAWGWINALLFREVHVDFRQREVRELTRLLGLLLVWRRRWGVGEFAGIHYYTYDDDESESETWYVALKLSEGKEIELQRFMAGPGQEPTGARTFAEQLSRDLGLQIVDSGKRGWRFYKK